MSSPGSRSMYAMRKITAVIFMSLDGVVEAPDQWHFPYFNDEMGAAVDAQLGAADTILLGRKTYDSLYRVAERGGARAMSGSVSVVRQVPAAGLLDELHLLVHPIAVRTGARLFD